MAAHLAQHLRADIDSDLLYERHAPDVYRYALAVLGDPAAAAHVTEATFARVRETLERGRRPRGGADTWLIRIAHALCRKHGGYDESVADELSREDDGDGTDACAAYEPLISRDLDGMLGTRGRVRLHAHLRSCDACRAHALRLRALQAAVRALAALPLPRSLARG